METKKNESKFYHQLWSNALNGWIPKQHLQAWLNVKETAMNQFSKKNSVRMTKIGNRVFYNINDVIEVLNNNVKH